MTRIQAIATYPKEHDLFMLCNEVFGVTPEMYGTRKREAVSARKVFCTIVRNFGNNYTLSLIGEMVTAFEGREWVMDHATVLYAINETGNHLCGLDAFSKRFSEMYNEVMVRTNYTFERFTVENPKEIVELMTEPIE
jgi:hypothetical protein